MLPQDENGYVAHALFFVQSGREETPLRRQRIDGYRGAYGYRGYGAGAAAVGAALSAQLGRGPTTAAAAATTLTVIWFARPILPVPRGASRWHIGLEDDQELIGIVRVYATHMLLSEGHQ
jgi:hypothetical protein